MCDSQKKSRYIISQCVWEQCSADYDAAKRIRTKVVTSETTVAEIMEWSNYSKALGCGDVTITEDK